MLHAYALFALLIQAQSDGARHLQEARNHYEALEYERCVESAAEARRWSLSAQEVAQLEVFAGLCQFNLGKQVKAAEHFRAAAMLDPAAQLPESVSPKVVTFFD